MELHLFITACLLLGRMVMADNTHSMCDSNVFQVYSDLHTLLGTFNMNELKLYVRTHRGRLRLVSDLLYV